jgi:thiol-disulfide isomerase/thioredoxin
MRKIILLLLAVSLFACKHDGSRTVIKGEIKNCKGKYLYFQEIKVKGDGPIDSTDLSSSGSFKIVKNLKLPSFYLLWIKGQKPITVVAQPGEKIKIEGLADSLFYNYKVSGSEDSKRAQIIKLMLDRTLNKLDSLNKVYHTFLNNPNIAQIKETLTNNYNRCIDEQREFTIMFLEQNPTSITNIIALYQQIDPQNNTFVLYKDEDFKYFDRTDSLLFKKYPNSPHVMALHANVNEMRLQQNKIKVQKLLSAMGAQAPEIALPSPNGDTLRLSSLKGKYVLLDFWASWCAPCRQENPNLVEIYAKYKALGFEIFQVSLDKSKDAWVKAIREDKLGWYHVSDLKYWDSKAAKLYNIESIPASILIDKDGTIIARNLMGDNLDDRLKDLLIK